MASIYGVEVKNVRCQADHEGCALYSADVWYNGKKLGHWSQDYWCGSCRTDFNESLLDDAVEKYRNSDLVEERYKAVIDPDIISWNIPTSENRRKRCFGRTAFFFYTLFARRHR